MRVEVHTRPGSSSPRVGGAHGRRLVVRVRERAVDGKATEAVRRALAESLGVAPSAVRLVSGASSRHKVLEVDGDRDQLAATVGRLLHIEDPPPSPQDR